MQLKIVARKKFIAVVGYPKSGKSTIIQSLSGCKNHSFKGLINDASAGVSIYVHAPSPQENPRTSERVFIKILDEVNKNLSCQGLLFAIQPTFAYKRLRMERMFEIACEKGFEGYAFVLEFPFAGGGKSSNIGKFKSIKQRILDSSNSKANVFAIDGRRFASLNSALIRSVARFPY